MNIEQRIERQAQIHVRTILRLLCQAMERILSPDPVNRSPHRFTPKERSSIARKAARTMKIRYTMAQRSEIAKKAARTRKRLAAAKKAAETKRLQPRTIRF